METKIIKIDQDNLDHKLMQEAGDLIAAGELVAFPTETVCFRSGGIKEDIQCKGASVGQSAYRTHIRFFGFGAHRKDSAGGCKEAFGCFLAGTSYHDSGEGRCSAVCHNRRHGHGSCAHA